MCGFATILDPRRRDGADRLNEVVGAMSSRLVHRGPDDEGIWVDAEAGVALGHRRLSIIDLSREGHQPMHSRCGRYVLVFNGEIYNFRQLRVELTSAGERFRGHSDTEVLLAAVARWGLRAALPRLEGMFALAVWDRQLRRLCTARDRMGEKPLYYGWIADRLLIASELKALRAHPDWNASIDTGALALFLRHRYVPAPYSIYAGVYKQRPGTLLEFHADSPVSRPDEYVYWSAREVAESGARDPLHLAEQEAIDRLESTLREGVRRQMVADVPVGAFLSGGVDSSVIVALMRDESRHRVRTFSIGFEVDGFDEAGHARAVADHLGTEHTELYVSAGDALAVVPELPHIYDEPFADDSQIPTYLLARLAREQVTVALSGDGGDELFAGYLRHYATRVIWQRIGRLPLFARRASARALAVVPPRRWDQVARLLGRDLLANGGQTGDRMQKLIGLLGAGGPEEMYLRLVSVWGEPTRVVPGAVEPPTAVSDPAGRADLDDFTLQMLYLDSVSYLPDQILVKVDRASMRVGLETRVPYLSHPVVELAARLPLSMKIRAGRGKWILRQLLDRHVPSRLVDRPKSGFTLPIGGWLRGPLRAWAEELLSAQRLTDTGLLDPVPIRRLWARHLAGDGNHQLELWNVLMLQAWTESLGPAGAVGSPSPLPALR